jgi:hypothetical protein
MNKIFQTICQFFKVMIEGQAYLNLFYLLAAFPLGVFYFVFLVSGLATGISLLIVWVGIPILLMMGIGWWMLAKFERFMAIFLLEENIPPIRLPRKVEDGFLGRLQNYMTYPVVWKSLSYLFLKFPLGVAGFVILVTLVSLTLACLTLPITYSFLPDFRVGIFLESGLPFWQVNSLNQAFVGTFFGLVLWPITLQVTNGLAWVNAKFARVLLSPNSLGEFVAIA